MAETENIGQDDLQRLNYRLDNQGKRIQALELWQATIRAKLTQRTKQAGRSRQIERESSVPLEEEAEEETTERMKIGDVMPDGAVLISRGDGQGNDDVNNNNNSTHFSGKTYPYAHYMRIQPKKSIGSEKPDGVKTAQEAVINNNNAKMADS